MNCAKEQTPALQGEGRKKDWRLVVDPLMSMIIDAHFAPVKDISQPDGRIDADYDPARRPGGRIEGR